jgi:hypothetical protein
VRAPQIVVDTIVAIVRDTGGIDPTTLVSVLISIVAVTVSLYTVRQQNIASAVTEKRHEWIGALRSALGDYLIAHHRLHRESGRLGQPRPEYLVKDGEPYFSRLKESEVRIWLLLNPERDAKAEKELESLLREARHRLDSTDASDQELEQLRALVRARGQEIIKNVWEHIKAEASSMGLHDS